jgi:hypothetical protein
LLGNFDFTIYFKLQIDGWWTYEFCYGKHIRQYHQEKNMPIRPQDEYFLGLAPSYSKTEATDANQKQLEVIIII